MASISEMASKELSILARYDDANRHCLFTFREEGMSKFAMDEIRRRQILRKNSKGAMKLQEELKQANNNRKTLELTLAQVRHDLEEEMNERQKLQVEVEQLARQLQLIKELVGDKSYNLLSEDDRRKLAFLNTSQACSGGSPSMMDTALIDDSYSLLSESEYDKTGDDLLMSRVKRRSKRKSHQNRSSELSMPRHVLTDATLKKYSKPPTAPPPESEGTGGDLTPPKRRRLVGGETETSVDTEDSLRPAPQTEVKLRRSTRRHNRSLSAGAVLYEEDLDTDSFQSIEPRRWTPSTNLTSAPKGILKKGGVDSPVSQSPPESPTLKRWASASKLQRQHNLFFKNVMNLEACKPCGKKIKFNTRAYKCKDCKEACHVECKDRLSQFCIPKGTTPSKGTQGNIISDFAPSNPPFVPSIILQCVNQVESKGFSEEGIYRKSGSDKEVKELKERFLKGKEPKLNQVHDIHVICGCLKDFLRNLKEPLIPTSLWASFVNAAQTSDEYQRFQAVRGAVKQLPPVNRDSIAFLILHLQRAETRMGIDNLAKVFGPTIVGFSVTTPEPMQMIHETGPQQNVMTALLEHNTDYWTDILGGIHSEIGSLDYDMGGDEPAGRYNQGYGIETPAPKSAAKVKKVDTGVNKTFFPSPMLK
ncbi:hypothetical protein EB796_021527 [Bugula neritina]|uniref:RACGAP1 n=1 Tax=Bugula neritina TaxID=10212 RepID=A0A7J7J398_BUGNE|nr:hypothetical protein EB796_021527 [Bugula neritina]